MSILDLLSKITNHLVKNEINIRKSFDYMNKYGYITDLQEKNIENIIDSVKKLQRLGGLIETGELDPKTINLLAQPRCACKDIEFITEKAGQPNKWGLSTVTWYVSGYDTEVNKTDWIDSIEIALSYWTEICNLKFERVEDIRNANVVYGIGRGRSSDFDGAGQTLAWMQLVPSYNFKGQVEGKFDEDETWIPRGKNGRGIYLVEVASHESGHHIIGSHSKRPNALMGPFYRQGLYKPQLDDDISRAVSLFGKPPTNPTPTPIPNPQPTNPEEQEIVVRLRGLGATVSIDGHRISKIS